VFEEEAKRLGDVGYLVQGTLYPDVIESVSVRGPSAVIKSHHNVGGLPEKDESQTDRAAARVVQRRSAADRKRVGVPEEILGRHPFPGPGLAVRIIGDINGEKIRLVQAADRILDEELRRQNCTTRSGRRFRCCCRFRLSA
jgi:GMP synthase (glutamine-hydrolysing)